MRFFLKETVFLLLILILPIFAENIDLNSEKNLAFVDSLVSHMSIDEKIGQMVLVYNSPLSFLKKYSVGGVLIMQNMLKKPEKLKKDLAKAQKELKIPLFISIDQEGGTVNRMSFMSKWKNAPSAKKLSKWSTDSIYRYQVELAKDLSSLGVNLNLAPVLDPDTNYLNIVTHIGNEDRSFGTNSEDILPKALAFSDAFLHYSIGSVIKHFPGYNVTENSDKNISIGSADSNSIKKNMEVFTAFGDRAVGVMMSSVLYKNYCDRPALFCSEIVKSARGISPNIIVITDDLWGTAVRSFTYPNHKITNTEYPDTAFQRVIELAVLAGNDMLMVTYPQKVPLIIERISDLAEKSESVRTHIDEAVKRVIRQKLRLGIIKN